MLNHWFRQREEGKLVIARILQKSPAAYCGKCAIGDVLEAVAYTRPYSLAELCEVAWGTVGTLLQIEVCPYHAKGKYCVDSFSLRVFALSFFPFLQMREGGGGPISTVHLLRQSPSESNLKIAGSFTDEVSSALLQLKGRVDALLSPLICRRKRPQLAFMSAFLKESFLCLSSRTAGIKILCTAGAGIWVFGCFQLETPTCCRIH